MSRSNRIKKLDFRKLHDIIFFELKGYKPDDMVVSGITLRITHAINDIYKKGELFKKYIPDTNDK